MTRSVHVSLYLLVCVWVSTAVSSAFGELTADHVAILANRNSSDSLAVARYYATRRGIPLERIVQLDLPARETMTRQEYEERLVRPVRVMLEANGLTRTTRVLVTTYGMPLRVDAPQPNESERRWVQEATERQRFARAYLAQIPEWAGHVAPSRPSEDSSSTPSTPKTIEGDRVLLEQADPLVERDRHEATHAADRDGEPEQPLAFGRAEPRLRIEPELIAARDRARHRPLGITN